MSVPDPLQNPGVGLFNWWSNAALRADLRRTLRLGLPLIGAQLLQIGNGLIDAIVAGRIGRGELAAGGIGGSLWFVVSLACIGLMAGLSPTLSRLIGDRRRAFVGAVFRQGLWLGLVTGLFALVVLLLVAANVHRFPFEPELPPLIRQYLVGASWSLPFFALVMAARNVCEATNLTRPVLLVTFMGLLVNVVASMGLGLGLWGLPELGLFGIGLATTLVNISMALALLLLLRGKRFARFELFARFDKPDWSQIGPMLSLSIPIFLGMLFEAGLFVATSVQMGMIGLVEAGAHQIAISATAFCFMLPLGMSFALTARIGRVAGLGRVAPVQLRIASGAVLTIGMAVMTASILILFRYQIASVYSADVELQHFAASLLILSAIFQLSDASQIMLIGALRGLHDTRVPMLINAFSYWVIAFGFGVFCAHVLELGAYGLWYGLITGLTVASLLLGLRLRNRLKLLAASGS
ncbi:MATE family efflux transporter [Granulosicoccus antarcticus]|uniref:Multidrug resistance protein NorM n=1 Tax=Granulosicoccus antarcticus IMCC3135 TaxID=1192854 RepID=A0A2Z2NMS2_9GAMM|nr:MATE family efflux transporter [Granulosicoccus antarcticus]ASJ71028.1 Multidrug resistance protein NorM [Granulosicoccus antarcticus IMCC3135]